tara:strand:- start:304 stop:537 length:234 start_codon:yes stop_codon:yes gene_type:complete
MSVERDQLSTSHTTSESSTSQRNLDYIQRKVDEFKDGVTDAMIHGTKDEKKQGYFFYKQGYDFGITLFCKQEEWTHD